MVDIHGSWAMGPPQVVWLHDGSMDPSFVVLFEATLWSHIFPHSLWATSHCGAIFADVVSICIRMLSFNDYTDYTVIYTRCLHVPQNIWKLRSPPWRFWWHSLKAASSSSLCRGRVIPMKCWRFCRFPCQFIKGSYGSYQINTIGPVFEGWTPRWLSPIFMAVEVIIPEHITSQQSFWTLRKWNMKCVTESPKILKDAYSHVWFLKYWIHWMTCGDCTLKSTLIRSLNVYFW